MSSLDDRPVRPVLESGRWLLSVGAKFARVVPFHTAFVVAFTLVSQVALLLASVLPLKVVILLGSDKVPRYFPDFLTGFDREPLIVFLAIAAGGFYGLHLSADWLTKSVADSGASRLLKRSRKITLFENQEQIARRAYQRYASGLAAIVFASLGYAFFVAFYPRLAVWVILYTATAVAVLGLAHHAFAFVRKRLSGKLAPAAHVVANVGFLSSFGFMVLDFFRGVAPGVLISVISLILVRQWARRVAAVVTDAAALSEQRLQITALYFHGQALLPVPLSAGSGYWSLFQEPFRSEWVEDAVRDATASDARLTGCAWRQTGIPGITTFLVAAAIGGRAAPARFLVKVFNSQCNTLAQHEATLLSHKSIVSLPAPRLLAVAAPRGFQCHVFALDAELPAPSGRVGVKVRQLMKELMKVDLPTGLIDQFVRSRPMLWQRLDKVMCDRVAVAADDPEQKSAIDEFSAALPSVRQVLRSLPLQLRNPGQNLDSLVESEAGTVVSLHWGRWTLEPVGSGWPVGKRAVLELEGALADARAVRPSLDAVEFSDVLLAARVFEFERLHQLQHFGAALELVSDIMACLHVAEDPIARTAARSL